MLSCFGQPFQPPVHLAYLLKAGIVLDGVSHTADNYYISRHIALSGINPVKTRGVWVGDVVLPCLVGYAHNWTLNANDYVAFSNAERNPCFLCSLPSKREKYPGGVRLTVTLEPLQALIAGLGRTLSTPLAAP